MPSIERLPKTEYCCWNDIQEFCLAKQGVDCACWCHKYDSQYSNRFRIVENCSSTGTYVYD